MKFRVKPTRVQWVMIFGAFLVLLGFIIIAVPEIAGIISPEVEDTLSEFEWDLPGWIVGILSFLSIVLAVILGWHAIHLWEGWVRRRRKERDNPD